MTHNRKAQYVHIVIVAKESHEETHLWLMCQSGSKIDVRIKSYIIYTSTL